MPINSNKLKDKLFGGKLSLFLTGQNVVGLTDIKQPTANLQLQRINSSLYQSNILASSSNVSGVSSAMIRNASVGLPDMKLPASQLQIRTKLTLNKQTIGRLNDGSPIQAVIFGITEPDWCDMPTWNDNCATLRGCGGFTNDNNCGWFTLLDKCLCSHPNAF